VADTLSPKDSGSKVSEGATQWLATDDQGRFTVAGLPPGARCEVYAIHPHGGRGSAKTFEVIDTKPIEVGDVILHPR
jgi:hypothetical protein